MMKKKGKHFGHLATFWFGIFVVVSMLVGMGSSWKHSEMDGMLF